MQSALRAGAFATAAGLVLGCSADEAPKAWSALATCIAGKSATEPLAARFKQLRLIQLANASSTGKEGWPARCGKYADSLYAALSTSGSPAVLRRQMQQKFNCSDDKATCALPTDGSIATLATDLWTAAEGAQLKAEVAADVPAPTAATPPLLDAPAWKSFSDKPVSISGPALTPDGRALVALKSREGRTRPKVCEFDAGFSKVHCVEANAQVPELPGQTVELVNDAKGMFVSSLTEKGLVAYNVQSGETSEVRGMARRLIRDGVTVEKGAKDDLSAAPPPAMPAPPKKGAKAPKQKPTQKEEGYVAVELKNGKASKDVKLPLKAPVGDPIAIGNQIVALNQGDGGVELVAQSLAQGRLKTTATLKGQYSGSLHSCRLGDQLVVAAYGGKSGQQNAKATGGDGKTQVSLAVFKDGAWSKTVETTLPFDRSYDSDLVCTKSGASLVWVKPTEGGVQVGRVDCSAEGCKASDTKVAGLESKWWWAAGPTGDKVFLLWRGAFGETRARSAPLAELGNAKDTLLFDSPDFGGPTAGDISALLTENAALLVFRNEQPVALSLGGDGAPKLLTL